MSEAKSSPWFSPMDTGAMPLTEPHPAPIFDTGPHPQPLHMWGTATDTLEPEVPELAEGPSDETSQHSGPLPVLPPPAVVPGQYLNVKWWKFVLLTLGVWVIADAVGVGLYYWWFHSPDKTWVDFTVMIYVIVCTVAALLVSMVEHRPMVSATSIAVMTAPFASGAAAAALYGMYVFGWIAP